MISGPVEWPCCRARLDGYRAAMDTAGVPVDPDLVRHGTSTSRAAAGTAPSCCSLPDPPTAIFTANDLQALGVYEAAREPACASRRTSASSASTTCLSTQWAGPPLTTVRQPLTRWAPPPPA